MALKASSCSPYVVAGLVAAAAACETGSPGQPWYPGSHPMSPSTVPTYYGDVKPILDRNCVGCHVHGGIAPFPLTSAEEATPLAWTIVNAVKAKTDGTSTAQWSGLCGGKPMRMPPWLAAPGCNSYADDPTLPPSDIATLSRWAENGAPAGDPSHAAAAPDNRNGLSRVDLELQMRRPFTPTIRPDDYRCFVLDWPESQPKFVAGFRALPGVPAIVHHTIAFLAPPDKAALFRSYDPDGNGYTCFGGPEPAATYKPGTLPNARLLGAWAPGGGGGDFARGTGIKVDPGSKVILNVHYNTLNGIATDRSKIQFMLEDSVDKQAAILFFSNPSWLLPGGMPIAAGASDVTHTFDYDLASVIGLVSDGVIPSGPFMVYGTALHMHLHGAGAELDLLRGPDRSKNCLLQIDDWNFRWQRLYELKAPVRVNPGDHVKLSCTWNNSAAAQPYIGGVKETPRYIEWGEASTDEMCTGFLYVTAAP